uniref:Immunoglobulin V-set domain-containing protein n=1 Tax=Pundamilia nyererei TaxID=303518 RepID=A0A3B4F3P2_9CICH
MHYILPILAATLADGNKLMKIEGFQGRNVSFQCSHRLAWAYDKYFCKDPCGSEKDRLATVKSGGRAESGRITLVDSGDGSFTVTLSHLQLSDSHQKYWCGVDRPGLDTYTQIQLTVKKGISREIISGLVCLPFSDEDIQLIFFTPSCLPIVDSLFPVWCRSTILFLVSFESSLVLAMAEFGV